MGRKNRVKEERKNLYFDLTCGIINSTLAFIGITFTTIVYGIRNVAGFYIGVIFFICYLGFSIFLIIIGIYTSQKEKKYGIVSKKKKKRELKPPIV